MNNDVKNQESSSPRRTRKQRSKRPDQQLYVPRGRRGQQQETSASVEKVPSQAKIEKNAQAEVIVQQEEKPANVTNTSSVDPEHLAGKDVLDSESPLSSVPEHVISEDKEAVLPQMSKAQRVQDIPDIPKSSHSKKDVPLHSKQGLTGSTKTSKEADASLGSDARTEESCHGGSAMRTDIVQSQPVPKLLHSNQTESYEGTATVEKNETDREKFSNTSGTFRNSEHDQKIVTAESGDSLDQINERNTKSSDVNSVSSNVEQSTNSKCESYEPKTDASRCNDQNKSSVVGPQQESSKSDLASNTEKVVDVSISSEARSEILPSTSELVEKLGEANRVTSSGVEDKKDQMEDKDDPVDQTSVGLSQADDEEDDDSWDKMFDESGESLLPEEVEDLTKEIKKTKITVKKPKNDYDNYNPKDTFDYTAFEHVIEIYDFPSEFKTQDLITTFSAFKSKGVDIKWVDDTHALAIFATPMVAQDALSLSNPMLRTRHLSLATRQSKLKARECVDSLQPFKPRPETSAVAARRLVSGALGIKTKVSREQRDLERQRIKQVKEKRREDKRQTEDIWEGKI